MRLNFYCWQMEYKEHIQSLYNIMINGLKDREIELYENTDIYDNFVRMLYIQYKQYNNRI